MSLRPDVFHFQKEGVHNRLLVFQILEADVDVRTARVLSALEKLMSEQFKPFWDSSITPLEIFYERNVKDTELQKPLVRYAKFIRKNTAEKFPSFAEFLQRRTRDCDYRQILVSLLDTGPA